MGLTDKSTMSDRISMLIFQSDLEKAIKEYNNIYNSIKFAPINESEFVKIATKIHTERLNRRDDD